jgi:hypothetical protein
MSTTLADLMNTKVLPSTTPDGYREQLKAANYLSYSTQLTAHSCPRKFLLDKATAAPEELDDNPDFLYGHAVAAGIQSYIAYGDYDRALLDCFLAWNGDLDTEKAKSKKNVWFAVAAVIRFTALSDSMLKGWEIAMIDGKPAIELAASINLENGWCYLMHIDLILVNVNTGQFMVLELKTTSFNSVHEASYKNSNQAIGYSIVLDSLARKLGIDSHNYAVLYLVYMSGAMEFEPLLFTKTIADRASWLHDLLVDCSILDMYREQHHYPMRGESCFSFFRPCEYFGVCNLQALTSKQDKLVVVDPAARIHGVDYYFTLSEIIDTEKAHLTT